ncbi:hypothetical protein TSUD_286680 [Trifolium subterraneum]|uniref:Reverse transcriptase zinc-binding domain-containing protein n=1 Tax=Trifolium subterraneum TaxID=3900 RepID=A0A2Z6LU22_TRISU|nr:hypothetical protein TSUD_286680 [Trifolium subterraneum]
MVDIKFETSGIYSVKLSYLSLIGEVQGVTVRPLAQIRALASLSKSWAPLKVVVFSYKLLQDRIPSRHNLLRRRVLATPESAICALCGLSGESSVHLFISCPVVSSAWYSVSYWLGWEYVSPRDLLGHLRLLWGWGRIGDLGVFFLWFGMLLCGPYGIGLNARWSIWWIGLNAPLGFGFLVRPWVTLAPYMSGGWNPPCAGLDRGDEYGFPVRLCFGLIRLFLPVFLF